MPSPWDVCVPATPPRKVCRVLDTWARMLPVAPGGSWCEMRKEPQGCPLDQMLQGT